MMMSLQQGLHRSILILWVSRLPTLQAMMKLLCFLKSKKSHSFFQTLILVKANSIKIFESSITSAKSTEKPGTITIKGNKTMLISTKTFDISIKSLQFEGKKRMDVEIFLAGFRISNYTKTLFQCNFIKIQKIYLNKDFKIFTQTCGNACSTAFSLNLLLQKNKSLTIKFYQYE